MTTTDEQQAQFAEMVLNHPAKQDVIDKIYLTIMQRFRNGSETERPEIIKILDSLDLFIGQLQIIADQSKTNIND